MEEKCYITRDEDSDIVWIWRKPLKGVWSPSNIGGKNFVNYQRTDRSLEAADSYEISDFKKKFNLSINYKIKKFVNIPVALLNNEDYKLISNNSERKR